MNRWSKWGGWHFWWPVLLADGIITLLILAAFLREAFAFLPLLAFWGAVAVFVISPFRS